MTTPCASPVAPPGVDENTFRVHDPSEDAPLTFAVTNLGEAFVDLGEQMIAHAMRADFVPGLDPLTPAQRATSEDPFEVSRCEHDVPFTQNCKDCTAYNVKRHKRGSGEASPKEAFSAGYKAHMFRPSPDYAGLDGAFEKWRGRRERAPAEGPPADCTHRMMGGRCVDCGATPNASAARVETELNRVRREALELVDEIHANGMARSREGDEGAADAYNDAGRDLSSLIGQSLDRSSRAAPSSCPTCGKPGGECDNHPVSTAARLREGSK